ncbi:MAG: PKD domain-containing protein [Bacteroidetes bacterium]|nr:PKD domain-containing protein [Bacteroidota bacterium]
MDINDCSKRTSNAGFTISDPNPPLGVDVQFTDASQGNETSWLWDFGDSDTAHRQNPTHAYASPGTYTVTFIAFSCDSSDTVSQTITVQRCSDYQRGSKRIYSKCAVR